MRFAFQKTARSQAPEGEAPRLHTLFSNVTEWSSHVKEALPGISKRYGVVGLAEHHAATVDKCEDVIGLLGSYGLRGAITPASPTGRGGTHGGVLSVAKTRYQTSTFRQLASDPAQALGLRVKDKLPPGPIHFDDFSAITVRIKNSPLTLIHVYLDDGVGAAGNNLVKLGRIGALLRIIRGPWAVIGDMNMSPQAMQDSGWPDQVGGMVVTAPGVHTTCTTGSGSLIDFAVCNNAARAMLE